MKNEINKKNLGCSNSIPKENEIKPTNNKEFRLDLLITGDYYIAFNEKQDIPIWNYLLNEDKTKLYIFDEKDQVIYDDLVINAPDELFDYGEHFIKVSFKGLNLDENLVTRENFYLFKKQFTFNKGCD